MRAPMGLEDKILAGIIATGAALLAGIFVTIFNAVRVDSRMMEQCLQDGRKEYECYSMIYKRGSVK